MNVSDAVKNAYISGSAEKQLIVEFPRLNLTVPMNKIVYESLTLKESILENDSIEFVGCISSELSITLYGVRDNLKGETMRVSIQVGSDTSTRIVIFYGIVDSVELEANHDKRKITAYDMLYRAGNVEVAPWYQNLVFPTTLKAIRDSLFYYIGMTQETIVLPNDSIVIDKQYKPETLRSIDVIKAICQINGVFGMVNRSGNFEYRILTEIKDDSIPGSTLFMPFTPGVASSIQNTGGQSTEEVPYYRNFDYQEYTVKPVDKLTIRQTENEPGVSYGDGTNNYIIQGNIFSYGLDDGVRTIMARNIYPNICGIVYRPFEAENDGMPWIECGLDNVDYYAYDYESQEYKAMKFYVFSRTMTGIQALKDSYSATGEEGQRQFLTDINTRVETIKENTREEVEIIIEEHDFTEQFEDFTYSRDEIDDLISSIPTGFDVQSVAQLPANPDENTIYLIQGEVVVN